MRFRFLVAFAAVGAVALAACGSSGSSSSNATAIPAAPVATVTHAGVAVKSGNTSLGTVLVSPSGRTLYGLMNDTKTKSTCTGACSMIWPPLLVDKGWTAAPGLDRSEFSTIVRADGTRQLVAGNWPLYTYAGDSRPGDVNGEGSGGVWFAVGTNGTFVKSAPVASTATANSGY